MAPSLGGGHFPGRAAIEAYGNGGFRFAGMSHRGSILCLPSGIWAWDAERPADLDAAAFARLFAEAEPIDMLLVGTGTDLVPLAAGLRQALRDRRIQADPMATGAAVRTYNILLAENRRVAGAFLAVEA
ncbi:Mth938-like domain-containing protein [Prosthecomicrobium sp. N25]|uniref:Mth938-like domain-containing protein n=1 Tax=Prosthecomicrobium sp. N25 TaxID=3129254 RepID=UPI0030781090